MSLTITLRDIEGLPSKTIEVNDSDEQLLLEGLRELRKRKEEAHKISWQVDRGRFTPHDFGIPQIDRLLTAIEGE